MTRSTRYLIFFPFLISKMYCNVRVRHLLFHFFFSWKLGDKSSKGSHYYFIFECLHGGCLYMGLLLRERGGKKGRGTCWNWCDILDGGLENTGFHFKGQHPCCEEKNFSVLNTNEACLSSGWSEGNIRLKQDHRTFLLGRMLLWYKCANMEWRASTNALSAFLR